MQRADLIGKRFGRLTVLARTTAPEGRPKKAFWLCRCDCGGEARAVSNTLTSGHTQSCGCLQRERISAAAKISSRTHGMSDHPLWSTWAAMRSRCRNPNATGYHRYGGRGIRVCERWNDFPSFVADVGERPSPDHTLDRIRNDGDYEPGNVRWATKEQQSANMRNNRLVQFKGQRMPVRTALRASGEVVSRYSVLRRIERGMSPEAALTTPARPAKPYNTQYKYKGKSLNLTEWAEATGVPVKLLRSRLRKGWTLKAAIETKKLERIVTYKGRRMRVSDALRAAGSKVSLQAVVYRLSRGWTVARAVETPRGDLVRR